MSANTHAFDVSALGRTKNNYRLAFLTVSSSGNRMESPIALSIAHAIISTRNEPRASRPHGSESHAHHLLPPPRHPLTTPILWFIWATRCALIQTATNRRNWVLWEWLWPPIFRNTHTHTHPRKTRQPLIRSLKYGVALPCIHSG